MLEPHEAEPTLARSRRRRVAGGLAGLTALGLAASWGWTRVDDRLQSAWAEAAVDAGRLDEAEWRLDRLIARHPRRPALRLLRARVAADRGEITLAEEILQRGVELGLAVEQARPLHDRLAAGAPVPERVEEARKK